MHLTLTDHLTCPRCGPSAGLILFMERAEERRVLTGSLGCPVCRAQYPIVDRVADLRATAGAGAGAGAGNSRAGAEAEARAGEAALRVAALLELGEARGFALVDGPAALAVAGAMAGLLPDQEVVAAIEAGEAAAARGVEVSAFLESGALPMADRTMRGVAYAGGVPDDARLRELVRVTRPTGRLVIETAGAAVPLDGPAATLERLGARVRARDATGLVAVVL